MRKRISADGKYYSEHKDSDTAYDFLKSDSCINDVKTHFSSVFEARKKIKKNYIKFIEFERVNLPSFDFFYLRNLKKLECLIFVKCQYNDYHQFLNKLNLNFKI
ncbi:hypothetical protein CWI38_1877p0020 [Hamiltosporidium tvaerminnensis]|uniref:Uncharacterized protein n=2 Tax=Hamiltosporidium TaxID=1176354 RepID=A0A4Q9L555_9MICR|nr:hypothetical protein CWI37_0446p0020 [Hamiltosporidium tvaerminnensis]TBU05768.1 hypothetical protein CWI36_0581p0020 [Hamiltosporidium magnivora]TBU10284.1 hypothetical protein CWI38_1877p0020 [Hamiltosporidium tvaerminnensis]